MTFEGADPARVVAVKNLVSGSWRGMRTDGPADLPAEISRILFSDTGVPPPSLPLPLPLTLRLGLSLFSTV